MSRSWTRSMSTQGKDNMHDQIVSVFDFVLLSEGWMSWYICTNPRNEAGILGFNMENSYLMLLEVSPLWGSNHLDICINCIKPETS